VQVGVFCTGQAELGGRAASLGQLWPAHEFVAVSRRKGERVPFDGLTTTRLRRDMALGVGITRLFQAVATALDDRRERHDLALLDDLELHGPAASLDNPSESPKNSASSMGTARWNETRSRNAPRIRCSR
jgi:hypothetical protein